MLTLSRYELTWDTYSSSYELDDSEINGIYSNSIVFYTLDDFHYGVSFRVGQNRTLGLLFAQVVIIYPNRLDMETRHYCMGQFYNNKGAKLFSQFALNNFIETENFTHCPGFNAIDYINGEPYTLGGDEIVSELI